MCMSGMPCKCRRTLNWNILLPVSSLLGKLEEFCNRMWKVTDYTPLQPKCFHINAVKLDSFTNAKLV